MDAEMGEKAIVAQFVLALANPLGWLAPGPERPSRRRRLTHATLAGLLMLSVGTLLPASASMAVELLASDGKEFDFFGRSVAIFGDTALVGAFEHDDLGGESGSAYVFRYNGTAWVFEQKLLASDGEVFDFFGRSVAISGDTAVVGAHQDNDNGTSSGSAYVFRYDGARDEDPWVQEAKLTASDGQPTDVFGVSVAVSGDTAVVGAFQSDCAVDVCRPMARIADSGAVYVFRYDGTTWVEEAKLTASDARVSDHFGFSVAVAGDTVVVGAAAADAKNTGFCDPFNALRVPNCNSGSAYVFRYVGGIWVEEAKLTALDARTRDQFGSSVAVAGDTAVIGAAPDFRRKDSGAAYVFRYNGATWDQEAKLTASPAAVADFFGFSVAVAATGDTAVVGAPFDNDVDCSLPSCQPAPPEGSAYVFRYDGTAWLEDAKLMALDGAEGDSFGMAVAVAADDTVLVGADFHDHNGMAAGSVYVLLPEPSVRALHTIAIGVLWGIARRSRRRQTQR